MLTAFRELIQERDLDQVTIANVVAQAGVGRSTFYEHFSSKNDLFAASVARPFALLADIIKSKPDMALLIRLLGHFWANRKLARAIFLGPARRKAVAVLVVLIEQRLKSRGLGRPGALIVSPRLAAVHLAEGLLGPVIAWLMGESRCTPEALALALDRVALASVQALSAQRDATSRAAIRIPAGRRG